MNKALVCRTDALGGYFATIETQLDDMGQGIAERLRGRMPAEQVRYCAKRYVVNWHVLQRYWYSSELYSQANTP
ncbi:MAG: hypothetical protein ACLUHA_06820 [Bacteroides stercoris]